MFLADLQHLVMAFRAPAHPLPEFSVIEHEDPGRFLPDIEEHCLNAGIPTALDAHRRGTVARERSQLVGTLQIVRDGLAAVSGLNPKPVCRDTCPIPPTYSVLSTKTAGQRQRGYFPAEEVPLSQKAHTPRQRGDHRRGVGGTSEAIHQGHSPLLPFKGLLGAPNARPSAGSR